MPTSYANAVNQNTSPVTTPTNQTPTNRSTATASLQDPNSNPLFVHNADHAGISLVSEKLTGLGNFNTWRRSMLMALGARNKLVFVNGTYPDIEESHPDYGSWTRCNNIICSWIVNAVDKPIAKSIMYLDTARQMWLDIHDQFKQSDGPRTAEIKQQIFTEVQGSQTVSEYYTRLKQLWEELKNHEASPSCCCGRLDCSSMKQLAQRDEQDRVLKFLMGLNDSFTATRGQILMMDPKPTLSRVFNLVSQEERQRSMKGGASSSSVVFQTSQMVETSNQTDQMVAAYGNNKPPQNRMVCSHCGKMGHTVNRCYKLHGFPPGYRTQGSYSKQQLQSATPTSKPNTNWPPKKENVANAVNQASDNLSLYDQHGGYFGNITADQIQRLLGVFNTTSVSNQNSCAQISGTKFTLADGSASTSQPQPPLNTFAITSTW